ncbi:MAG TPA: hypothetical protein VMV49_15780 [Candidatus Deferrimicrobium sp.]|nr:hypothetical protein [Candidatus Deferrimicrobium sp.]
MPAKTQKGIEAKLKILKSIIDSYPFGYTLMEIYKNFKDRHKIGSRNTLKKYLDVMLKKGEIITKEIGNYRIFRSKNPYTVKNLFEHYPYLENFSINFIAALNKVLKDEMPLKGKQIGIELAKSAPILESKVIKQFQKFKDFFQIMDFKEFIEKMREKTLLEFETNVEVTINEKEAFLTFRNTNLLKKHAWIFYYSIAGLIEANLNDIFYQQVSVNVESIDEEICIIKLEKRQA